MSLKKYIENKELNAISVNINPYKNKLYADLSSLLLKPCYEKINEIKKKFINVEKLYQDLSELNYPHKDQLCIAVSSSNIERIQNAQHRFKEFYVNKNYLHKQIESCLFDYQVTLISPDLQTEAVDHIFDSYLYEANQFLEKLSQKIEFIISKISTWKNYEINLEAQQSEDFHLNECKIKAGNQFYCEFLYKKTLSDFQIINYQESNAPEDLKNNIKELIRQLKGNPKYNQIINLYMVRPISERAFYENLKTEISLGYKNSLPNNLFLTDAPLVSNMDLWKIKTEQKYVKKINGNLQYKVVGDELPIKWIERMNDER
jgi:hypothetical protein